MRLIDNTSVNPYFNMAAEEYLFNTGKDDVFMLWQNAPCVVIGKNQNALSEIDSDVLRRENVGLVRRLTGGGAVYHDLGNLNYSLFLHHTDRNYDFSQFSRIVADCLGRMGLKAEYSGRNDLLLDGCKISGCSQLLHNGRLLHHGTLLISSDLTALSRVLRPSAEKYTGRAIRSVASRVCNVNDHLKVKVTAAQMKDRLFRSMDINPADTFSEEELKEIGRLQHEKYSTWKWNYGDFPRYDFANQAKFASGLVHVTFSAKQGYMECLKFSGDFFGNRDIRELELLLRGKRHQENSLMEALNSIDMEDYIHGVSAKEIIGLLF